MNGRRQFQAEWGAGGERVVTGHAHLHHLRPFTDRDGEHRLCPQEFRGLNAHGQTWPVDWRYFLRPQPEQLPRSLSRRHRHARCTSYLGAILSRHQSQERHGWRTNE